MLKGKVMGITNTVGCGGVNNHQDVTEVQKALVNQGFSLKIDGIIGAHTRAAIKSFQRHLMRNSDGIISPNGTTSKHLFGNNIAATVKSPVLNIAQESINMVQSVIKHSTADKVTPDGIAVSNSGAGMQVVAGQFTFDQEGSANISSRFFSRVLQHPSFSSGVTIGRGYDMKLRGSDVVFGDLTRAGVDSDIADIMSQGAGLVGNAATNFVKKYKNICGSITAQNEITLFNNTYVTYILDTKGLYGRSIDPNNHHHHHHHHHKGKHQQEPIQKLLPLNGVIWDELQQKLKDILIDMHFQGYIYRHQIPHNFSDNDTNKAVTFIRTLIPGKYDNRNNKRIEYLQN